MKKILKKYIVFITTKDHFQKKENKTNKNIYQKNILFAGQRLINFLFNLNNPLINKN